MTMHTCPSHEELQNFALGLSDETQLAYIEEHVRQCSECLAALERLQESSDSLLSAMKEAGSPRSSLDETAVLELMQRLNNPPDVAPVAAMKETSEFTQVRPGISIGPYKLLEQIGEGGFGVVFMADQQHPVRRKVAIKVVKPGMDTRQVIARFEAERQALALMEHPNIARVFDGGETSSGHPFFVMELVRGQPIAKFCDDARLSTPERLRLFVDVCHAVQHAHQKGVIHRDLKPSNVLVTLHGDTPVVKVIDFGIAKATGEQLTDKTVFTGIAQFVGTPLYMSPEQAALSGLDIDTRSDVYSLGVMLYELLTGTTPLRAERLKQAAIDEVRRLICEEDPDRPSTRISKLGESAVEVSLRRKTEPSRLRQALQSELDWIVLKAIEKDRARRYDTVNGLAADIKRYLADEPVSACPPSTAYRLTKILRRHRTAAIATIAIFLALLLGFIGTTWQAVRATLAETSVKQERDTARKQTIEAVKNLNRAQDAEEKLKEQLWQSYHDQAQARRFSGRPGRRFDSLAAIEQAAKIRPSIELRNEAIAAMALADLKIDKEWPGFRGGMVEVASVFFDANCKTYSRSDHHGMTSIRRVSDDSEIVRLQGPDASSLTQLFSRDGRFFSANYHPRNNAAYSNKLVVWRIPEGTSHFELNEKMVHRALDFSPDCRRLAVGERDGTVRLYSTEDGRETSSLAVGTPTLTLRFDPSGKRIAIVSMLKSTVEIRDVGSGQVVATLQPAKAGIPGRVTDVAWHPSSDTLAVASGPTFSLWDSVNGSLQKMVEGHSLSIIDQVAFSREGDLLATSSWSGEMALWDTLLYERVLTVPLAINHAWGQRFQFSPRDQLLGYDLRVPNVRVWRLAKGRECLQLPGTGKRGVAFHPEGRLMAVCDDEGLRLWDVVLLKSVAFLKRPCSNVKFHPNGNALILASLGKLERWPLKFDRTKEQIQIEMGPPESLNVVNSQNFVLSDAGREIAVASPEGNCTLINWETPKKRQLFGPHPRMVHCDASSDNRWIATGTWQGDGVKIWQRETGELHCDLPGSIGSAIPLFSPNCEWLAVSEEGGLRVWNVSDWSPGAFVEASILGSVTFSPDSRVLAHGTHHVLKLYTVPDLKEVASLTPPNEKGFESIAFNGDGSRLAVSAMGMLQVWDLRAIRTQLAKMNLDWEAPPYPPNDVTPEPAAPLVLDVIEPDSLERRGYKFAVKGQWREALAPFRKARELQPENLWFWLYEAICLVSQNDQTGYQQLCSDLRERFRNTKVPNEQSGVAKILSLAPNAVSADEWPLIRRMAEEAVRAAPLEAMHEERLGSICYWIGDYKSAIVHLESARQKERQKNNSAGLSSSSIGLKLFLAMAYQQDGKKLLAQEALFLGTSQIANDSRSQQTWHDRQIAQLHLTEARKVTGISQRAEESYQAAFKYAAQSQWKAALNNFREARVSSPAVFRFWLPEATLLLETGDEAGYRDLCDACVQQFSATDISAYLPCGLALVLAPNELSRDQWQTIRDTLDKASNETGNPMFNELRGSVCYRLGDYETAVKHLNLALDQTQELKWKGIKLPIAKLVLAMAYQRSNNPEQAQKLLYSEPEDLDKSWVSELTRKAVSSEAQRLVRGDASRSP